MNEETQVKELMLKIPFEVIRSIVVDTVNKGESVVEQLDKLKHKWVIVAKDEQGSMFVQGFSEYDECANQVAYFHGTEFQVVYVLRDGTPRKNVRVEVKARL